MLCWSYFQVVDRLSVKNDFHLYCYIGLNMYRAMDVFLG